MSDEPIKKPGMRPDKPTLDRLQAELSADLKTGEDPLYYDWTRVAEAPPSEAAYVPPMQIQTHFMDTRDLAAVIGPEAAEAARHAPLPGHTVVIDEGNARADQAFEVDTFGDAIPTEKMHGAPIPDGRYAAARRLAAVGHRGRSGWIWVASAIAVVLGCAAFVLTQRGVDSGATPTDTASSNDLGAVTAPTHSTVFAAPASVAAPSTPRTAVSVADLPADPATRIPLSHIPPRKAIPSTVQQPEHSPSRRSPTFGSPTRSRVPSPTTPPKATGDEVADPILSEHPGY